MIFTFYSFKGGVGRSMALANVAELLLRRGLNVLMVDFDLEAPGLERFFETRATTTPYEQILRSRGVIDFLVSYKNLQEIGGQLARSRSDPEPLSDTDPKQEASDAAPKQEEQQEDTETPLVIEPLQNFIIPIRSSENGGELWLMPAGRRDENEYSLYANRVRGFDWNDFYINWQGGEFFDRFVKEVEKFDVTLIDSRTGIAEMSGVCTHHLADAVIMFVAPNQQNLDGTKKNCGKPVKSECGRFSTVGPPRKSIAIARDPEPN